MNNKFSTPILFLFFNRFDEAKLVFSKIKELKPPILYLASDGPRPSVENENNIVLEIRNYILNSIDWVCEIKCLFRNDNLGCKIAVSSAINWFFEAEEYGIILEDDCLPDISFFYFCQDALRFYKNDNSIMSICGTNILKNKKESSNSAFFSSYSLMWGWATWARAWKLYDIYLSNWSNFELNSFLLFKFGFYKGFLWKLIYKEVSLDKIDTWDYQWIFTCWYYKGLTLYPTKNLVKNIGFNDKATHTSNIDPYRSNLTIEPIDTPINFSKNFVINKSFDKFITKYWFHISFRTFIKFLISKV